MFRHIITKFLIIIACAMIVSGSLGVGYIAAAAEPCQGETDRRTTDIVLQVPILGDQCVHDIADYIARVYRFFVGSIGLIAVVMIMIGGFQWLMAAGNSQRIESAKETIFSAIAGLVLALGSYTILNIINPDLVKLKIGALPPVTGSLQKFSTCPDRDPSNNIFACGYYYKRTSDGTMANRPGLKGGAQKNVIRKFTPEDNPCRGLFCPKLAVPIGQSATTLDSSCFPASSTQEFGDPYTCVAVKCPAPGSSDASLGCVWYQNLITTMSSIDDVLRIQDNSSKNTIIGYLCAQDYCGLNGSGCVSGWRFCGNRN